MTPAEIVSRLPREKIEEILSELNSGQYKAVLRAGGLSTKVPSACVLQKARRRIWSKRIREGLGSGREALASELLYQWLLFHRRQMLMDYLDGLGVSHVRGETEETFTKTVPPGKLTERAFELMKEHDARDVAIYVLFLDHHQESDVFAEQDRILQALGSSSPPSTEGS
jgi:hypothetical protein